MTAAPDIHERFHKWAKQQVTVDFPDVEFGIANQHIENVAWLQIDSKRAIAGVKLWDRRSLRELGKYVLHLRTRRKSADLP